MKRTLTVLSLLAVPALLWAITADGIITRIDGNQLFRTEKFTATMVIKKGKRKLIKRFYGYGQRAGEKSFMAFTNPEDRGVKYLKLDQELWIYFPDADDIMKISGHMLRQGMMGSDISYEDMMETEEIRRLYRPELVKESALDGAPCYVVRLTARVPRANYASKVLYVDKTSFVPLKIELYARGGRLLKVIRQYDVRRIGARYVPGRMVIRDLRKRDSSTEIIFNQINFDVALPAGIFSRRNLRR